MILIPHSKVEILLRKSISFLLIFVLIALNFYHTLPAFAASGQIRQEINILGGYLGAPANTVATSSEIIQFGADDYSGTATFYFEIVASTSAAFSNTVVLTDSVGGSVCTITIPNPTTSYTLLRSSACTIPASSDNYRVKISSNAGGTTGVLSARIVVLQSFADVATEATLTKTHIDIGNEELGKTNTATGPLSQPKYWKYDASKWDGTITVGARVSYQNTQTSSTTLYTVPGTYTYVPSRGESYTQIELWGSGGGGRCTTSTTGGSGGGGGAYARSTTTQDGVNDTLVVSATSTCGTTTSNDSTWNTNVVIADGGVGSAGSATTTGGSLANSVGQVEFAGGSGAIPLTTNDTGGGGGGAAGPNGAGADGSRAPTGAATSGGGGGGGNGGSRPNNSATGGASVNGGAGGNGGVGAANGSNGQSHVNGGGGGGGNGSTSATGNRGGYGGSPGGGGGGGDLAASAPFGNGGRGQARIMATHGAVGIAIEEDDGTLNNWTFKAQIVADAVATTSSTLSVAGIPFTPVDGRHYRLVASTTAAGASYNIYNAHITVQQTSAFTKLEPQYLIANTGLSSGTSLQNFATKWDSTEWSGVTNTYIHEVSAADNSTSVVGLYTSGDVLVTGSTVTSPDIRGVSGSMTMPSNTDLKVKATTNNGDVYSSRILVQTVFVADTIDITGTLYSDEGTTPYTTGGQVITLRVGTSTPGIFSTTTLSGSGFWRFSNLSAPATSDVLVSVWADNSPSLRAFTFTQASSTVNDIPDLDLYQNRVIVKHEATSAASITNAELGVYDGDDDSDIQFVSNSNALAVRPGQELYIWPSKRFVPGGTVTLHGNAGSAPDGDLDIRTGSVFDAGGSISIAGNLNVESNSSFVLNGNTTTFAATTSGKTISISSSTHRFGNTVFNGANGGWTFSTNATTSNLTITAGTVIAPSFLEVQGNYSNSGIFTNSSGILNFSSTSNQTIGGTLTGTSALGGLRFAGSGTKTLSSNASTTGDITIPSGVTLSAPSLLSIGGNYTNSGTFTSNSGTILFDGTDQTLSGTLRNTSPLANVWFGGSGTKTIGTNASTTDFIIKSGVTVTAPSTLLDISGNYSNYGTFDDNFGTILFSGALSSTLEGNMVDTSDFYKLIFNGSGTKTFNSNASSTWSFTINSGATVSAPSLLSLSNDYTNNGTFTSNSGTVLFSGTNLTGTLTGTSAFHGLWLAGGGTKTFGSNASSTGNLTIVSGTTLSAPSLLSIGGNYTNSGTFTSNSGTILFDGTDQTLSGTLINTSALANVWFGGSGTKTFNSNASTTNFTINAGTVVAPSLLSISGNYTNNGTFTSNSGTVLFGGTTQSLTGTLTDTSAFGNMWFGGSGTKTISTNASTTDFIIKSGVTVIAPLLLDISGNYSSAGTFSANSGTTTFSGTNQSLTTNTSIVTSFNNLLLGGSGTKTFNSNASSTGNLIIASGVTLSAPSLFSVGGNYINNGTFTSNSGTILISTSTNAQSLSGNITETSAFGNMWFGGSGAKTFSSNASTTGNLTIASGATVSAPSLLSIEGNYTNNGTFTNNSGTTLFSTTTSLTISGNLTNTSALGNVWFGGSGTKTFNSNASTTNFTINAGTVASPSLLSISGDYINSSFFNGSGGTLLFGGSDQSLSGTMTGSSADFNGLWFGGSGTKTFSSNASTTGNLTIASGATVSAPSLLSIEGNYTNNGTFTNNSGTTLFSTTTSLTISGNLTNTSALGNVWFGGSGTKTFNSNASTTNFTLVQGTFSSGAYYLSVSGDYYFSGTLSGTPLFLFDGADQSLSGTMTGTADFNAGVTFSGSGTKTFNNDASFISSLNVLSGVTISAPSTLTLSGDFSNLGTFTHNSGTVNLIGSSQSLSGNLTNTSALYSVVSSGAGTRFFVSNASTTNLTNSSGTLSAPSLLSVSGDYVNNGTFTNNSGTIFFDGTTQSLTGTLAGTSAFSNVWFQGSGTKTIGANASSTGNLTIASGSTVVAPSLLSVGGNYTNDGTFTNSSGTLLISTSTNNQSLSGTLTNTSALGNIWFGGSGTKTFNSNASTTNFTINAGTVASPSLLSISGDYINNGIFDNKAGTTTFSGTNQSLTGNLIGTSAFAGLMFEGSGTKTFNNSASSTGIFYIKSGSTVVAPSTLLSVGGWFINEGTFTNNSGTLLISTTSRSHTLSGNLTGTSALGNVWFGGSSNTKTFNSNASTTNFTINAGGIVYTPALLSISGNYFNNNVTLSSSANATTTFDGADQSISGTLGGSFGAYTLRNIIFEGSGTKTFNNNASTTSFIIKPGVTVVAPSLLTVEGSQYINEGTFTHSSGDVFFENYGNKISGNLTGTSAFNNIWFLHVTNSPRILSNASTTNFIIKNGSTVYTPALLSIAGNYVDDATGSSGLRSNSGTIIFSSDSSQTISGKATTTSAFTNLVFEGSGTKTFDMTNASTTGNLLIKSGSTVVAPNSFLSIGGNYTNDGTFTNNSGNLLISTTTATAQSLTGTLTNTSALGNIWFGGSGTKTFNSNASTTNFTINAGTVVAPAILQVDGNYTNNGIFSANSGTTTFAGSALQTIAGNLKGTSAFYNVEVKNNSGTDPQSDPSVIFSAAASTTNNFYVVTPSVKVQFLAGLTATTSLTNLILNGQDTSTRVSLRSTSAGTPFGLEVAGTRAVSYANVGDSNACSSLEYIYATNGTNFDAGGNTCWWFTTPGGATLSSASNVVFEINQPYGNASLITITDGIIPTITSANDLRLSIATSSINIKWLTSVTSATFGGTASGKVTNSLSYEGSDSVVVIPVSSNFSASDTLTISGLAFTDLTTATSAVIALGLLKDGPSDIVTDATDGATVAIKGKYSLQNHTDGQVGNKLETSGTSLLSENIFQFRLVPVGENVSVTNLEFSLSDVQGISQVDFANTYVYIDYDGDGVVDAGETQVGGLGSVSIADGSGTITFSSSFTATTSRNYILQTDINNISSSDEFVIALFNSQFTSSGLTSLQSITPTGVINAKAHKNIGRRGGGGGGGQPSSEDTPPPGQGIQTGGSEGGDNPGQGPDEPPPSGGGNEGGGGSGGGDEVYNPHRNSFVAFVWSSIKSVFTR